MCFIFYSLPGNVDYPWSSATSLSFDYSTAFISTSAGPAVALLNGTGTRTFTNRFGDSFTSPLSLVVSPSSPPLLYLHNTTAVDSTGLMLSLSQPIQLPGEGPLPLFSTLQLYASNGKVLESNSASIDALGTAIVSTVPTFVNVTIAPANLNALAAQYDSCRAPITFTNGLRAPTQPSTSNGAVRISYFYSITDGLSYISQANLTLTATSAFGNAQDMLGSHYQLLINITGTRNYTYLPTGAVLVSTVTGLSSASTGSVPPSQRFYPYSLLASSPGLYSVNTAPFIDADGVSFSIQPSAPLLGLPLGQGTLRSTVRLYIGLSGSGSSALMEAGYLTSPVSTLQQQLYTLLQ